MSSKRKLRELAMISLHQHFLLQKDIKECMYGDSEADEIGPFLYTVTIDVIRYQDIYTDKTNATPHQDWIFACPDFMEQAVLTMAACELNLEAAPKAIIIDEVVTLAKKYYNDEAYRLIDGVPDRL